MHHLYTITGVSGSGKTTVAKALFPPSQTIISYTTRKPRPGEVPNEDYYYVSEAQLNQLKPQWIEHVTFDQHAYAFTKNEIQTKLTMAPCLMVVNAPGLDCLLQQTWLHPLLHPIFFQASLTKIKQNLMTRQDDPQHIQARLQLCHQEWQAIQTTMHHLQQQHIAYQIIHTDPLNAPQLIQTVQELIQQQEPHWKSLLQKGN